MLFRCIIYCSKAHVIELASPIIFHTNHAKRFIIGKKRRHDADCKKLRLSWRWFFARILSFPFSFPQSLSEHISSSPKVGLIASSRRHERHDPLEVQWIAVHFGDCSGQPVRYLQPSPSNPSKSPHSIKSIFRDRPDLLDEPYRKEKPVYEPLDYPSTVRVMTLRIAEIVRPYEGAKRLASKRPLSRGPVSKGPASMGPASRGHTSRGHTSRGLAGKVAGRQRGPAGAMQSSRAATWYS